jgi:predicted RNA methylase
MDGNTRRVKPPAVEDANTMTSRIAYNNPSGNGSLGLSYHYELLSDRRRLRPLMRAIALAAKGRRVLESGAGSGVLSILAAKAGARMVYSTEPDPEVARFTRDNVARSEYSHLIRILDKDTRCVTLRDIDDSPVDMVIAEHLSTWQVTEPQIPVMNYINQTLATETAIRIPEGLTNYVELACSKFCFEDIVELRTQYFEFSGIPKPSILSDPGEVQRVRFNEINPASVSRCVELQATRSGIVNSLRLTSPLQVFRNIRFQSSDSLVPPVIVPLENDVEVSAGDVVEIDVEYASVTDWSRVRCEARVERPEENETNVKVGDPAAR